MKSFELIYQAALERTGGVTALNALLPVPRTEKELKQLSDPICLANMSRRIFQAGLNRKLVDDKWPAFEEVFHQFDIGAVRTMSDEALERLMEEPRIVRHWRKLQSVRHNAEAIHAFNETQGGFVNYIAEWPTDNIVALWEVLKTRFKQLGGASGAYFLRRIKKDTFLLTADVIVALKQWEAITIAPQNKTQRRQVQACMNIWQAESGYAYSQISQILALSVDWHRI